MYQADLLAVGTSGRRGLSRLILGSVAEALIKRAGCPVQTVRNEGVRREEEWR
jgi:nucleotide-binding universal stress UspA family protein